MNHSSIAQLLNVQAKKYGNKPFVEFQGKVLTYHEFDEQTTTLAHYFQTLGIKKDTPVCIFLPNCLEFLLSWFALMKLGAIMVPINPSFNVEEAGYILSHTETKFCVVNETTNRVIQNITSVSPISTQTILTKLKSHVKDFSTSLKMTNREDTAAILYTSGTTGKPKGVILLHRSYVVGGESFAFRAQLTDKDRMGVILPLFHVNAQVYSIMGGLIAGATLILYPKFSASNFWKDIVADKITQFNFLGVVANILLKQPQTKEEIEHYVRVAFGAGLSKETIVRFEKRFKIPLIETFGLTECPMGTSNLLTNRKIGSIGKASVHPDPKLNTQVKIVDEQDKEVSVGEIGEITLKSSALFNGYFKNEKATREVLKNGWFHTGDISYKDQDGYFYFVDRKKDIIRKKGENISSKEIEDVILKLPEVAEVAVIPIPGALGDDDIKVYIVLKPQQTLDEQTVLTHCEKNLSVFKTPALVEFIDTLPKTPTQKIAKQELKRHYKESMYLPEDVVIIGGIRTPIGKFWGALKDTRPDELLAQCLTHIAKTYNIKKIDDVITGCSNQSGEDSKNISRMAVLLSSLPNSTPASTVTRLSASGLEAVRQVTNAIRGEKRQALIAAGVESFSRSSFILPRKDKTSPQTIDQAIDSKLGWRFLHPKLKNILKSSGAAVETLLNRYKISREEQDAYAIESNKRAYEQYVAPIISHPGLSRIRNSSDSGRTSFARMTEDVLPLTELTRDEIPRRDLTIQRLSELPPMISPHGTLTAGNSSKMGDGAGAIFITSKEYALKHKLKPQAIIIHTTVVATEPDDYGIAPVPAIRKLLNETGLTLDHMGVIEIHEAYALQVLACLKELRLPHKRVNRWGGAVALGHPYGASGIRLVLSVINQLHTYQETYGLIAMCIGGGQGMAILIKSI